MEGVNALSYAERQLAAAETKAEAWRRIVEGLHGLNGEAPLFVPHDLAKEAADQDDGTLTVTVTRTQNGRPKGMEAVRRLIAERPGPWTLREFHEEFDSRGWKHTEDRRKFHAAVDSAVYRLCKLGEGHQTGPGAFEFAALVQQEVLAA